MHKIYIFATELLHIYTEWFLPFPSIYAQCLRCVTVKKIVVRETRLYMEDIIDGSRYGCTSAWYYFVWNNVFKYTVKENAKNCMEIVLTMNAVLDRQESTVNIAKIVALCTWKNLVDSFHNLFQPRQKMIGSWIKFKNLLKISI